jgi:hypothetical protein
MNETVLIQHARGALREARRGMSIDGVTRFIWTDGNGHEGVDINNTTRRSPFGAWRLFSKNSSK